MQAGVLVGVPVFLVPMAPSQSPGGLATEPDANFLIMPGDTSLPLRRSWPVRDVAKRGIRCHHMGRITRVRPTIYGPGSLGSHSPGPRFGLRQRRSWSKRSWTGAERGFAPIAPTTPPSTQVHVTIVATA
jgi:hypothetical protein